MSSEGHPEDRHLEVLENVNSQSAELAQKATHGQWPMLYQELP